ncbi:PREDICTED: probable disease resistance protein At1g59620 [Camelina sativa]|uniref:Probable disease resistance protein At1g59620 n=1 Tax=Camelina sativa TaxID=90675 RepID=A0ABM1RR80_CAMSA|nr:PREDICTED: probable disease resistance protein At1g59620 [Camelina sativa]XP_019101518.1 PREDICTED: probable disease resistance protein At1g59620 [Camelina sativa]XP_019101519.1 PREDICTED: probable disease resistance protein At1g59620 [Camelina sativa]
MAETLLSFGFEKLLDLIFRESERFQGVEEQFNGLKSELETLRGFLEDADAKKHTSTMVRNTVKEIKEIVYDAEDIIETFLLKEELGKTSGIKKRIRQLACVIADRRGLAFDMEALSKRIAKVIRDMQILGFQQVIVSENVTQSIHERERVMRHTFSSDYEDHLVGLDKNVEQLVGYLVEEDRSQVVSITGMGGIGKTTLARQVFNHETVKSHFTGLAWVCVSQQFTRQYVWQTILRKLKPHLVLEMTEDELQENLFQVLETQQSLIVLDDIWTEGDWDIIKPIFPREKGWKVLLTSRNEGVGLHATPTCFNFRPDCLTPEESWTLFQRIAFPRVKTSEHNADDEEMEEMGKQMVKHCGGLPLAVKVLGGLLAAQYTFRVWKRVYENIGSHIIGETSFSDKNISSVYQILYMSFEELPIYLKHCFLYLAHFPEDYAIDVGNLYYYWAAEGIPRPRYYDGASDREVADGYIEELVKRNMIISERDIMTSRYETCQLHDMMREVCLRKSEDENFVHIVDANTGNSQSPCISRRLVIDLPGHRFNMEVHMLNPKLRSLLFIKQLPRLDKMSTSLCFTRLQLMRVLDLSRCRFDGGKLPSSIGKLIHLKYLSLYRAWVSHLPSSMRNLKLLLHLNLDVLGCPIYMSNFLKEFQELRYLYLPWEIQNKTKLELGNLINLETLHNFSTKHSSVTDLQRMTKLRGLSIIFNSEECTMEALSSSVSEFRHLESLIIYGYKVYAPNSDEEGFVLDCRHLKQLNLTIYMPSLPDEQHFSSYLTTISLHHCRLVEDPMPILEKMLHLKVVTLWHNAFVGRRMVCSSGGFLQLQKLILKELSQLVEWIVEERSMALLRTMTIRHCESLKELPDGLRFITSLKELSIYTSKWEFLVKLKEGGQDYYKVQHIPLLKIPVFDKITSDEDSPTIDNQANIF